MNRRPKTDLASAIEVVRWPYARWLKVQTIFVNDPEGWRRQQYLLHLDSVLCGGIVDALQQGWVVVPPIQIREQKRATMYGSEENISIELRVLIDDGRIREGSGYGRGQWRDIVFRVGIDEESESRGWKLYEPQYNDGSTG